MKKSIFLIQIISSLFFSCGSVKNVQNVQIPEWYSNYRSVYPTSQYIAQRGSGKSFEESKTDASSQIARYFKSTVNANLTTTMNAIQKGDYVEDTSTVINDVSVTSNMELFGIEYSEGFLNKNDKQYYCIAYINREDAWTQFVPQIESAKSKFYGFLTKGQNEEEPINKVKFYKSSWESGKEFLEKLEYGRLLNPTKEATYQQDRNEVSNVPSLIQQEMQNITVKIEIEGDNSNIIQTAISSSLSKNGFTVGNSGNYCAVVKVESNVEGNDPLSISPSVKIELNGKNEKSFYSYQYKSSEKTVSYILEKAQKKAFPKIAEIIQNALDSELQKQFGL